MIANTAKIEMMSPAIPKPRADFPFLVAFVPTPEKINARIRMTVPA